MSLLKPARCGPVERAALLRPALDSGPGREVERAALWGSTGMSKQEVKDQMVCSAPAARGRGDGAFMRPRRLRGRERETRAAMADQRERPRATAPCPRRRGTAPKFRRGFDKKPTARRDGPSGRGGIGAINIWGPTPCPRGNRCGCARNGSCRTGSTTPCRHASRETGPRRAQ